MWQALSRAGRNLWHGAVDLLYPPACLACRRVLAASAERDGSPLSTFCASCAASLAGDAEKTCPRCAATIGPHTLLDDGCSRCRAERFAFATACRLGVYEGVLREQVLRLKHHRAESQAELLGEILAVRRQALLEETGAEIVVPVPLHWWRRLRRGCNQSESIARGLARRLRLPLNTSCLWRCRRTLSQASLSPSRRRDNVRGAFRTSGKVPRGRTVLLVDDVLTTGMTLHESARALRDAGAACVVVAVLARAGID